MAEASYILSEIKRIVSEKDNEAIVYLYGSRARGTAREESDWDLLILLNKEKITLQLEKDITYPLYDLELETGEIISPMVYSLNEWTTKYKSTPYYNNVMRDGKKL